MDEIEEFIKIDTKIEGWNGYYNIYYIRYTITPLRIIKFLKKLKLLFEDLKDDRIKTIFDDF